MDNFLETHSPPKLNQEEIGDLKRPITRSEIESVIKKKNKKPKKLPTRKSRARWFHKRVLTNMQGRTYRDPSQTAKRWKRKEHSKDILESHYHLIAKPDEGSTKRRENYKPISLMNINAKILNNILANQIQ